MNDSNSNETDLPALFLGLLLTLGGAAVSGLMVRYGWNVYMVPVGLHAITYWHAMGLTVLLAMLSGKVKIKNSEKEPLAVCAELWGTMLFGWLFLWLFSFGMPS